MVLLEKFNNLSSVEKMSEIGVKIWRRHRFMRWWCGICHTA